MNSPSYVPDQLNPAQSDLFELEVVCVEKGQEITRTVRELVFTPETLEALWLKYGAHKTLFWDDAEVTFQGFLNRFFFQQEDGSLLPKGLFFVVDDFVGIIYLTEIVPGVNAVAHFAFFDRKLDGRLDLVRKMIKYAFDEFNFHRLSVEIPLYASKHLFPFVEALGFRNEGRRRQYVSKYGKWFDVKLYYLLKEKYTDGS